MGGGPFTYVQYVVLVSTGVAPDASSRRSSPARSRQLASSTAKAHPAPAGKEAWEVGDTLLMAHWWGHPHGTLGAKRRL